jgi:hypothetical protein
MIIDEVSRNPKIFNGNCKSDLIRCLFAGGPYVFWQLLALFNDEKMFFQQFQQITTVNSILIFFSNYIEN